MGGTMVESLMCVVNNRTSTRYHTICTAIRIYTECIRQMVILHTQNCMVWHKRMAAWCEGSKSSGISRPNCSQNPTRVFASDASPTCSKITCGTITHRKWTSSPSRPSHECGWIGVPVVTKRRAFTGDTWTCHLQHAATW